jgi:lysophospholipase L1-like esterase
VTDLPSRVGLWLCFAVAGVSACSKPTPVAPAPEVIGAPRLTCPASLNLAATAQLSIVNYTAPVVADGTPPVTSTCTIASGATFPLGTTSVICTAQDGASRAAQCTFDVKLTAVPKLKGTKILAFGDSITCCEVAPSTTVQLYDASHSYPTILQELATARYTAQPVQVFQQGSEGETASAGENRLVDAVNNTQPDALLLLEGTNDVNAGKPTGQIASALKADIRRAKDRGVRLVLLSTLLPEVVENCQAGVTCRAFDPSGVLDLNDAIRDMASSEGVVLVDMYGVFLPRVSTLIGNDGLHATVEGYQVMAETFLTALAANFEEPIPPGPTAVAATLTGARLMAPRAPTAR